MHIKRKIIFIVDVKYRDLEALKRIGLHLRNLDYKSFYLPSNIDNKTIYDINPSAIVIPKANYRKRVSNTNYFYLIFY